MVSAPLHVTCVDCGHRRLDHLAAGACDAELDCGCPKFNRGADVIEGAPVQLERSQILSETLRRVIHRGSVFSEAFFATLFERHPHLRERFVRLDREGRQAKLWAALTTIANAGIAPSGLVGYLGHSHAIGGVLSEDFEPFTTVLLETLERFVGDDLTASSFSAKPDPNVMRQKYEKLLTNLVNAVVALVIGEAVRQAGGIPLKPIMKRALHMSDELHSRSTAAALLFTRELFLPLLDLAAAGRDRVQKAIVAMTEDHYFFLRLSMAAARVLVLGASRDAASMTINLPLACFDDNAVLSANLRTFF